MRLRLVVVVCLVVLASWATSEASSIVIPVNGNISPFGEPDNATIGQTFKTVNATDVVLDSFSFWVDDNDAQDPDAIDFAGYVMEWDAALTRATGPVLYASAMQTTTNNGGADGMERFDFLTGGLVLNSASTYVAFLSASDFFDGAVGRGSMGLNANLYADGGVVFSDNLDNFGLLTTSSWQTVFAGGFDLGFEAQFSSPTGVPEPTSLLLFGTGAAGLLAKARRRKRQDAQRL